ncbi:MAG TPA: hypothetical protein VGI45_11570 [Terracidiphilus sp.]
MATTNILPIYIRISRTILGKTARSHRVGSMELVEGLDRMWLTLRCPMHAWSWPRANHEERLSGFDAHQTCYKCNSSRMFDSHEWLAGPVFKRRARD